MKVWDWRQAIQIAKIPSTTKLILLNLSCYMNSQGQSCWPSIDTQSKTTGLSKTAVIKHLKIAEQKGFIVITKQYFEGQGWLNNTYVAVHPSDIDCLNDLDENELPNLVNDDDYLVNEVNHPSKRGAPPLVNVVNTNSPLQLSNKLSNIYTCDFLEFYNLYPRKIGKKNALKSYKTAIKEIKHDELIDSTRKFAKFHEEQKTEQRYIPHPSTWLNRGGWDDELTPDSKNPKGETSNGGTSGARAFRVAAFKSFSE